MRTGPIKKGTKTLWKEVDVTTRAHERVWGIMFRPRVGRPLLIEFAREAREANGIHAFFCVEFDAVFLTSAGVVVDVRAHVKPWTPLVVPRASCRFVLETPPGESRRVRLGDRLTLP